jgi:hypothetical protein
MNPAPSPRNPGATGTPRQDDYPSPYLPEKPCDFPSGASACGSDPMRRHWESPPTQCIEIPGILPGAARPPSSRPRLALPRHEANAVPPNAFPQPRPRPRRYTGAVRPIAFPQPCQDEPTPALKEEGAGTASTTLLPLISNEGIRSCAPPHSALRPTCPGVDSGPATAPPEPFTVRPGLPMSVSPRLHLPSSPGCAPRTPGGQPQNSHILTAFRPRRLRVRKPTAVVGYPHERFTLLRPFSLRFTSRASLPPPRQPPGIPSQARLPDPP